MGVKIYIQEKLIQWYVAQLQYVVDGKPKCMFVKCNGYKHDIYLSQIAKIKIKNYLLLFWETYLK